MIIVTQHGSEIARFDDMISLCIQFRPYNQIQDYNYFDTKKNEWISWLEVDQAIEEWNR